MNISLPKINTISFGSRNASIRKADDIMRTAKNAFPMVSSTYIDTFYKETSKEKTALKEKVKEKVSKQIDFERNAYYSEFPAQYGFKIELKDRKILNAALLRCIHQGKAGNCAENAALAVSALAANGYYDTKSVYLLLATEYIDKKTKKTLYTGRERMDHTFAITSMGKYSDKEKDLIVVDPWLHFVDSVSGAKARFKQILCDDETMNAINKKEEAQFRLKSKFNNWDITPDDCIKKQYFIFCSTDISTVQEKEMLHKHIKDNYPNMVVH